MHVKERLANILVYPQGKAVEAGLLERLDADLHDPSLFSGYNDGDEQLRGLFVDLNADSVDEFVFFVTPTVHLYKRQAGAWVHEGQLVTKDLKPSESLAALLLAGEISVHEPEWRELSIGRHRFRLSD
jgi:hypothetical protein